VAACSVVAFFAALEVACSGVSTGFCSALRQATAFPAINA
jgi:hypothetical protein